MQRGSRNDLPASPTGRPRSPRKRPAPPSVDRQFSLVLALLMTERGLTKADILSSVHGYRERLDAGEPVESVDRMFERDKAALRELGVPVLAEADAWESENNQLTRYRIREGEFAMPAGLAFDAEESGYLHAAARLWREGSVSEQAGRALMKLKLRGVATSGSLLGVSPRLRMRDAAYDDLAEAIAQGRAVAFDYAKADAERPERRVLEPHALVRHADRWLVSGFDRGRADDRMFLLSRIAGPVSLLGAADRGRAGARTPEEHAAVALDRLRELERRQRARIAVRPGSDAELRLARRAVRTGETDAGSGWPVVEVGYSDLALLADEVAWYGPELVAVAPAALREAVVDRLERVARDHEGDALDLPAAPARAPRESRAAGRPTTAHELSLRIALVPYLRQREGRAPVAETARDLGVSEEEIVRAVRAIAVSGAPGETATYSDEALFDIDWDALGEGFDDHDRPIVVPEEEREIVVRRFVALEEPPVLSNRELASLLAGLQLLRDMPGAHDHAAIERLAAKLAAAAGAPGSGDAANAGPIIRVDDADRPADAGSARDDAPGAASAGARATPGLPAHLVGFFETLHGAIVDRRRVRFTYRKEAARGDESRTVDPIALSSLGDEWYLDAWDLARGAQRRFLLARMIDLERLDEAAGEHEIGDPDVYFTPDEDAAEFRLDVAVSVLPFVREFSSRQSVVVPRDAARIRIEGAASNWAAVSRLALRFAGLVRVESPASAREAVRGRALATLALYGPSR